MGTYPNFEVNKYEQNYIPLFYSSRGRLWERLGPIGGGRQVVEKGQMMFQTMKQ